MNLSVIQRISAGYGLLITFMLVLVITAISSIRSINTSLQTINQQAAPVRQITSDISAELAELNLIMYQHYNSDSQSALSGYERQFSQFRTNHEAMLDELKRLLDQIDNSDQAQAQLASLQQQSPAVFDKIAQTMELYRHSLDGAEALNTISEQVTALASHLPELTDALERLNLNTRQRQQLTRVQQSLMQGVSLAKQLGQTQNLTAFHALNTEFAGWLKQYVALSDTLGQQGGSRALQQQAKALDTIASDLAWLLSNYQGLRERKGFYLSTRNTLVKSLQENEAALQELRSKFANINDFAETFSGRISARTQASVSSNQGLILAIAAVGILAAIIITLLIIRSIKAPLAAVLKSLGLMATGDLTESINSSGRDEFAQLRQSASTLNTNLRAMIEQIQAQSSQITSVISSTQHSTGNTREAINEQKAQTEMVASAMHEMTATIREIAQISEQTFQQMLAAHESAETSQRHIEDNRLINQELQAEMHNTGEIITKLDGDVNKINEVLQVIDSIAQQTNLLALNAAIEAARAGESGRGFAVVADEVRTLASRTQNSTEEIKNSIEQLLGASSQAVQAIDDSQDKTRASADMAQIIFEQVEKIVTIVSDTKDMNMQIATAAEQQSRTSEEINNNIVRINELAEDTNDGATESEHQVQSLTQSAETLRTQVSQFRL
jgi:methyl-accepting chemotaxis protein